MSSAYELLRECSSFYTNNESDPWEMHFPVISSINGETFSAIMRILKHRISYPSQKTAVTIFGEAGFGKTHMIGRIRRECENSDISAFFSNIRPIIDERSPMRHLIKGIITSLAHDIEGTPEYTQIHQIVLEIILDYYHERVKGNTKIEKKLDEIQKHVNFFFRQYKDKKSRADILKDPVSEWICGKNCNINPHFIKLLFAFCNPDLRTLAFQRFTGNIADKDDADNLGVPFREDISDNALEDESREFIISLGLILESYGYVLLVCFDQLENIHQKEQISAFGLMILTLVNECKSMLPLAMSRTLHWDEVIKPVSEQSVIERLNSNTFSLYGCSEKEIEEILLSRIKACIGGEWKEAYSWLLARMKGKLTPRPSPREVLSLANQIILQGDANTNSNNHEILVPTPDEVISSAYQNERDQILSDMSSWPPDYEELTEAICFYLTAKQIFFTQERLARKVILKISDPKRKCCIIVNTNANHSAIGAGFTYGTEYMQKNPDSSCIFLTDPRCLISKPNWKQTNEKKDSFFSIGGKIFQPSEGDIARFYALYSMKCKITEGDLLFDTQSGVRSITIDEFISYIKNQDPNIIPLFHSHNGKPVKKKKTKKSSDIVIHNAICEILRPASMHVMKSIIITERLNSQGIQITHDDLLIWCGDHKESYVVFRSPQGSTIMLKGLADLCSK